MKHRGLLGMAMAMALVLGLGTQSKANSALLSELLGPKPPTLVAGGCVSFDTFGSLVNNPDLSIDPSKILVSTVQDNITGNYGLAFSFYTPNGLIVAPGAALFLSFAYQAHAQAGLSLTGAQTRIYSYNTPPGSGGVNGDGVINANKTVSTLGGSTLLNLTATTPSPLTPSGTFPATKDVNVGDSFYFQGNTSGLQVNRIDQYYACTTLTPIPEPSSVVLMGMGLGTLGALVIRRRRRVTA